MNEENKIRLVIDCDDEFRFSDFIDVLNFTSTFLEICYDKANENIRNEKEKLDFKTNQPLVASVGNGCIWVDVVVPVACALIPIIYDIAKNYRNEKIKVDAEKKELRIDPNILHSKMRWDSNDTYEFTYEVYKTYVKKKKTISSEDFIKKLPAKLRKYGNSSLLCKLYNTKALLEKYGINNTLNCKSLPHYSKEHEIIFKKIEKKGI